MAQEIEEIFLARIFTDSSGNKMPYRLFIPKDYNQTSLYPIIMYLHGGGGAGTDNIKQITGYNTNGTHVWLTPENQAKYPTFVVAPQLPGMNRWNTWDSPNLSLYARVAMELLKALIKEFNIDPDRVYLTGQSRGGYGTWDIVSKCPDFFAAAVPLCGGGNSRTVEAIRNVPIWAFHGAQDQYVTVESSRVMVEALRKIGGNIRYTEYPNFGHNVADTAYLEPELIEWLFAQKRQYK
jgi:predicted peptidase